MKKLGLIEIEPSSIENWKAWGAELMGDSYSEALETLREEGMNQEHTFLLEIDGKSFLGFFSEGNKLPTNLSREINKNHKELLEKSSVRRIEGVLLYSLRVEKQPADDSTAT